MKLRPYQTDLKNKIYDKWNQGCKNILAVSPTGSGKTVLFSDVIKDHSGACCAIAHRQELVTQISIALARDNVPHKIIGPPDVVRLAVSIHMNECGVSYYNPNSLCAVAGVDTLIRRKDSLSHWMNSVTKWVIDEGHHLLLKNKWGKAVNMFPNAVGLGVTATPTRADGHGLGRRADGLFDSMIEGPQMRELINMGYLTDYRVFAPPSDIDLTNVTIGASGEYSHKKLKNAIKKSHVVGDVVDHYLKIAPNKLGITFADSVDTAYEISNEYNRRGVKSAVVSAKTSNSDRVDILRRFKSRNLMQLVNVDLFGEGFDLPAIEVVSMARPTQSYSLYVQQFGRALRLMISDVLSSAWDSYSDEQRKIFISQSIKPVAIIIDHVGNVMRHNLPDKPKIWSLDRRNRKQQSNENDGQPVRTCFNPDCLSVYESFRKVCPYCGTKPIPGSRSKPEFVDGDLLELDAETLAVMRDEVLKVDADKEVHRAECIKKFMPRVGEYASVKRHVKRQQMQKILRESIAWWAGYQRYKGYDDSESYKIFYFKFGIDVLTAQALNSKEAVILTDKINNELSRLAL